MGEFWRRWHISPSTWFRDYVFIPLGGSRVARGRLAFNVMLVFTVSGLWHGASFSFLLWGALMGLGVLPDALARRRRPRIGPGGLPPVAGAARMLRTFLFISVGWVLFRAPTLADAMLIYRRIVSDVLTPCIQAAILAVVLVRYPGRDNTYLEAVVDKHARASDAASPRLLLSGGSSVAFGFDSPTLERETQLTPTSASTSASAPTTFSRRRSRSRSQATSLSCPSSTSSSSNAARSSRCSRCSRFVPRAPST